MSLRLLDGPVLLGFAELFDRAYGDPSTPKPYATVAPVRGVGGLSPFECPRCGSAQAADAKARREYRDPVRGHSWCSSCGLRYVLDESGTSNHEALVMRDGKVVPRRDEDVFALIGVD